MHEFLTWFLPVYLLLFFGITLIAETLLVFRRIRFNACALTQIQGVEGIIAGYFKLISVMTVILVALEEQYLFDHGEIYTDYQREVRRWL